jgi:hypothetical protein
MPIGDPSWFDFHTICTILADVDRVIPTNQTTAMSHSGWLSIAYHDPLSKWTLWFNMGQTPDRAKRSEALLRGLSWQVANNTYLR